MYSKIPLWYVSNEGLILLNGSFVFAYEVFFPSLEGVEDKNIQDDVERLSVFLKSLVKNKSVYVSLLFETTKDKSFILERYKKIHAKHFLMSKISNYRIESLKDRLIRRTKFIVCIPMYNSAVEFQKVLKSSPNAIKKNLEDIIAFSDVLDKEIKNFFSSNYQTTPVRLTGQQMWQHLFSMINPDYQPPDILIRSYDDIHKSYREQLFLGDFIDEEGVDYLRYRDRYIISISMDLLPESISPIAGSLFLSKIPFPCRYCVTIELPNQVDAKNKLSKTRKSTNIFVFTRSGSPEVEWNRSKVNDIDELFKQDKSFIVRVSASICVEGKTEMEAEEKSFNVINTFLSELRTSSCYINNLKKVQTYISTLGYFPNYAYNSQWTEIHPAVSFAAIRGMFLGTVEQPVILFSNRENSITCINPVTKRQSKWSFVVIGPTGSGKSFVTNYILLSLLSFNPMVVIFDLAPMSSYRTLAYVCDGEYIEAKPSTKRNQVKNPFDFKLGFNNVPDSKYIFFDRFFSFILSDENSPLHKEDYELLRRAIQRVYSKVLFESPRAIPEDEYFQKYRKFGTWINLRDHALELALKNKDNPEMREKYIELADFAHKQAMPTLIDLASVFAFDDAVNSTSSEKEVAQKLRKRLALYTDGVCRGLFAGTTNFKATKDFTVVNLGFLKDNPNLLIPTFLSYREHFWEKMAVYMDEVPDIMKEIYGEEYWLNQQQRYKFILIDEYHNFNVCKDVILLTDKDFRQSRTYGIVCGIITQSLRDIIYESKTERFSIFESAANKFFLRHTTPQNPQRAVVDYVIEKTGMNPKEAELFASLSMSPGKYSEIYYMGEDVGRGVLRYEPLPIELWINTTHKDERYLRDMLIEKMVEQGIERKEAVGLVVSTLAELYPAGVVGVSEDERDKIFYRILSELIAKVKEEQAVQVA